MHKFHVPFGMLEMVAQAKTKATAKATTMPKAQVKKPNMTALRRHN